MCHRCKDNMWHACTTHGRVQLEKTHGRCGQLIESSFDKWQVIWMNNVVPFGTPPLAL
jgi:hypothetical protein